MGIIGRFANLALILSVSGILFFGQITYSLSDNESLGDANQ